MSEPNAPDNAVVVARQLAERLESRGQEYAFRPRDCPGLLGRPRGTVDVDLTLYLPPDRPSECVGCCKSWVVSFRPPKSFDRCASTASVA